MRTAVISIQFSGDLFTLAIGCVVAEVVRLDPLPFRLRMHRSFSYSGWPARESERASGHQKKQVRIRESGAVSMWVLVGLGLMRLNT